MKRGEALEIVRGSGNVLRDLDRDNADAEQFRRSSPPKSSKRACTTTPFGSALTRF
jgi:hypothetical protein